jgi:hypothetical protein
MESWVWLSVLACWWQAAGFDLQLDVSSLFLLPVKTGEQPHARLVLTRKTAYFWSARVIVLVVQSRILPKEVGSRDKTKLRATHLAWNRCRSGDLPVHFRVLNHQNIVMAWWVGNASPVKAYKNQPKLLKSSFVSENLTLLLLLLTTQ